jgi:hypothetical protein
LEEKVPQLVLISYLKVCVPTLGDSGGVTTVPFKVQVPVPISVQTPKFLTGTGMVTVAPEQIGAGSVIVTTPVGGITVIVKLTVPPEQVTPLRV